MNPEDVYLFVNGKLWQLEWCQNDIFERNEILREIEYACGALRM